MLSKNDSPSCSASLARSVAVLVSVASRSAAVLVSVADSSIVLPRALRVWDDILMVIPSRVFWFSLEAELHQEKLTLSWVALGSLELL